MKNILIVLVLSLGSAAFANPIVHTSKSVFATAAQTSSCLAKRASTNIPVKDIEPNYVRFSAMEFLRFENERPLEISKILITVDIPNQAPYICEVSGAQLFALDKRWHEAQRAILPAKMERFSPDCQLTCGGMTANAKFISTGTIEVFGSAKNADGQETAQVMRNVFEVRKN